MKKIYSFIFLSLLSLWVTGCSKDSDSDDALMGKWESEVYEDYWEYEGNGVQTLKKRRYTYYLIFKMGGLGEYGGSLFASSSGPMWWTKSGDKVNVKFGSYMGSGLNYTISGHTLSGPYGPLRHVNW